MFKKNENKKKYSDKDLARVKENFEKGLRLQKHLKQEEQFEEDRIKKAKENYPDIKLIESFAGYAPDLSIEQDGNQIILKADQIIPFIDDVMSIFPINQLERINQRIENQHIE